MRFIFAVLACSGSVFGMNRPITADAPENAAVQEIRVMGVARTPEPNTVILKIALPKTGDTVDGNPVWMQFRVDGYSLGSGSSQFVRSDEIAVSDLGQTVHVIIDNRPYFPIKDPAINPFNEEGWYYTTGYRFKIPFSLKEGLHTIRIFPARSFGESLKEENTFAVGYFYLGEKSAEGIPDFSKPYLTFNEPGDQIKLTANQPVLLDFLIANCDLSPDGYKVRLSIDGRVIRDLSSWQPYYIYGLSKGKHTIRLELFNEKTKVPGEWNDVERTILIAG